MQLDPKGLKPWATKAWRAPHLNSARQELRRAIERGEIIRPTQCELCGKTPPPMKDGRSAIQGHHHDYSLPLDVQWLCYQCHRDVTPVPKRSLGGARKGSSNHNSKLTEESVRQIRSRYVPWVVSVGRLATEYGVSRKVIREIVKGRAWTHV